jgi:hypothetical protein
VDPEDVLEDIRGLFMEYDDGVAYLEAEVEIDIAVNVAHYVEDDPSNLLRRYIAP